MFCVPLPNEKWRPVINLKPFNQFVENGKFHMETVGDMHSILRCGMWAATVHCAFVLVNLRPSSRKGGYKNNAAKIMTLAKLP